MGDREFSHYYHTKSDMGSGTKVSNSFLENSHKKSEKPIIHEISDDEIEEASRQINYGGGSMGWIKDAFKKGARWYREQLKLKGGQQ